MRKQSRFPTPGGRAIAGHETSFALLRVTSLACVAAGVLAACGGAKTKSQLAGADATASQPADDFEFDDAQEAKLDASVMKSDSTAPGQSVVTLYFDGGLKGNCARWSFKVIGDGLALAEGAKLDDEHQEALTLGDEEEIIGKLDTRGPVEGLRFLAPYKAKIRLKGLQDYCLTKDKTDFDVNIDVTSTKRKRLFTGVETAGQTAVRLRVSAPKEGEEGEAAAEPAPESEEQP